VARVQFAPRNYGETIDLGLQVTFAQSGHLVGSAMCQLEWQRHRIVYTGDVTFESRLFVEPLADLIGEVMIIDGSYGTQKLTKKTTEEQLLDLIRAAVTQGGSVLLPLPRFGRSQEVLLLLYEHRDELPPIFVEVKHSRRWRGLSQIQRLAASGRDRTTANHARFFALAFRRDCGTAARRAANCAAIVLATDAMISNGAVVDYFHGFGDAPQNSIIFTGYQAPGTPGRRLLDGEREIETSRGMLSVRAQVANVTLKAHPDYNENCLLIGRTTLGFHRT